MTAALYTDSYYQNSVGGVEFFRMYGCRILKPSFQAAVRAVDMGRPMKVLDVGCGRGELTAHLAQAGHDALGIDPSPDAVAIARSTFPSARYEAGLLKDVSRPEGGFERIFCLGTIEHLTDDEIAGLFRDAERLLSKGGLLIVSTCVNRFYYKFWSHGLRRLAARALRRLGLDVRDPLPPRSEEDGQVHVNEQDFFSLRRHGLRRGWTASVSVLPNPKMRLRRLYGDELPADFPVREKSVLARAVFGAFFFFPLSLFLGRSYLSVYRKVS